MKLLKNNKLPLALLVIAALFHLNIAQSVTTASTSTGKISHLMANGVAMEDIPLDEYWNTVEGRPFKLTGEVRKYYLAAEKVVWDYGPLGSNVALGIEYDDNAKQYTEATTTTIGTKYYKCLYFEYTDSTFTTKKNRAPIDDYMGFLGPALRAEVGDIMKVELVNRCDFAVSISPHGVFTDKANEGNPYNDGTTGKDTLDNAIQPGSSYTYTWPIPERCGPGPMDGSSVVWPYHSDAGLAEADEYAGLIGMIVITRKGYGRRDATPMDVDRELFILFQISNENNSPYLAESWADFSLAPPGTPLPGGGAFGPFGTSNQMHTINGYVYGNGPIPTMKKNQKVRWYMLSLGTFFDGHTPHWHGNTLLFKDMRMDVIAMQSSETLIGDMCPDNVGIWLFHCHVNDHLDDGMVTRFEVLEN